MSRPLIGLTVRWSLAGCAPDTLNKLTSYVAETSHARFTDMPGLGFKTWRARDDEWFEGCYVVAIAEGARGFHTSSRNPGG